MFWRAGLDLGEGVREESAKRVAERCLLGGVLEQLGDGHGGGFGKSGKLKDQSFFCPHTMINFLCCPFRPSPLYFVEFLSLLLFRACFHTANFLRSHTLLSCREGPQVDHFGQPGGRSGMDLELGEWTASKNFFRNCLLKFTLENSGSNQVV